MSDIYAYPGYTTAQVHEALDGISICKFGPRCTNDTCDYAHILSGDDSKRLPPKQKLCTFVFTQDGCSKKPNECKFNHELKETADGLYVRWGNDEQRSKFEASL